MKGLLMGTVGGSALTSPAASGTYDGPDDTISLKVLRGGPTDVDAALGENLVSYSSTYNGTGTVTLESGETVAIGDL